MATLFTGKGGSGSWQIRGAQLGAIGDAIPNVSDPAGYGAAVVVKRVTPGILQGLRARRVPWIWDVVDAYPQPASLWWSRADALRWLRTQIETLRPDGILWPNQRMMEDAAHFSGNIPSRVLYHHHRPGLRLNPIRPLISTIGYEGAPTLGAWRATLEAECARRGWRFVMNPGALADVDVVVALRDPTGYTAQQWKSNVKLANAHGSGTPFVGAPEAGYLETQSGAEYWTTSAAALATAFDWLESQTAREQIRDRFLACAYPLERAQSDLREFLCQFR